MVYRGKLSKACQPCRRRQLRCDRGRPACGQCVRAQLTCSGYRDTSQLRILDETHSTVRKLAIKKLENGQLLPGSLVLSLDLRARSLFFAYYVDGISKSYDYVRLFYSEDILDGHLATTVDAVSLAYFFVQTQAPSVLERARLKYISALRLTNSALQSSELAVKDATLLSALLLDLYEKMTNHNPHSSISWISHVKGALSLVELRGNGQFQDPIVIRMLVSFSTKLVISCVVASTSVPAELIGLRTHLEGYLDAKNPKWRLTSLMVHFANLRASIGSKKTYGDEALAIISDLDAKLARLMQDMPSDWQFITVFPKRLSPRILHQYYHVYKDHHVTQTWNVIRTIRILLNELLHGPFQDKYCFPDPPTHNIIGLASEICASVPQYVESLQERLQDRPSPITSSSRVFSEQAGTHKSDNATLLMQCYTLIFPLYVAGRSRVTPPGIKRWIVKELHFIGSTLNIREAKLVALMLEQGDETCVWSVYAMLGSYAFSA